MSNGNRGSIHGIWLITVALAALCLSLGCSASGSGPGEAPSTDAAEGDGAESSRSAATLPIPGGATPPPDHPPFSGMAKRLIWDVPEGWQSERPKSTMRIAQYTVDGPGGPAECVVYYFGPSQGGDSMANARRWAGQFSQADGSSSLDVMKMADLEGGAVPLQLVEVTGTYDGGMTMTSAPSEPQPNAMLLGGIAEGPDAPWFFKFTGPEQTVRAQREAFVGMLTSVRPEG